MCPGYPRRIGRNTQDNHLLKPKNSLKDTVYTIPNIPASLVWALLGKSQPLHCNTCPGKPWKHPAFFTCLVCSNDFELLHRKKTTLPLARDIYFWCTFTSLCSFNESVQACRGGSDAFEVEHLGQQNFTMIHVVLLVGWHKIQYNQKNWNPSIIRTESSVSGLRAVSQTPKNHAHTHKLRA